jgi:hypothetical protein
LTRPIGIDTEEFRRDYEALSRRDWPYQAGFRYAQVAAFVISLLYELLWAGERSRWYRYAERDRYGPPGPDEPRY